jgi:hypothetical protein
VGKVFEMNKNQVSLASAEPVPIDTANDKLSFRKWRRRVIDQIMSNKDLSPTARLIGYSIAERLEQATRCTKASSMTLGRAVGIKPDAAQDGLDELIAAGQAHVHYTERGTRVISLWPYIPTGGSDTPVLAESAFFRTRAYPAFLSARARFLTNLFADRGVSSPDKLVAFAATRFIDVESGVIDHTSKAIGAVIGYGSEAVRKAVGRLVAAGYFSKDRAPGGKAVLTPAMDPGMNSGTNTGTDSGTAKTRNADSTATSSPLPYLPWSPEDSQKETYQEVSPRERSSLCGGSTKTLEAAHGLWRRILLEFGVPYGALTGKHQPCPACGGKDRFRYDDRHGDGDYYCNVCGPGKGISLVAKVNGWSYAEAARRIDELIGNKGRRRAA